MVDLRDQPNDMKGVLPWSALDQLFSLQRL
jgi:hypothetical protein